jgi:hypothetical protein
VTNRTTPEAAQAESAERRFWVGILLLALVVLIVVGVACLALVQNNSAKDNVIGILAKTNEAGAQGVTLGEDKGVKFGSGPAVDVTEWETDAAGVSDCVRGVSLEAKCKNDCAPNRGFLIEYKDSYGCTCSRDLWEVQR